MLVGVELVVIDLHVVCLFPLQVMVTGGRNTGRIGTIVNRERHPGSFDIVHIKDAVGHEVCIRIGSVYWKETLLWPKRLTSLRCQLDNQLANQTLRFVL